MIKEIRMENYKSVQKLKLNPGRITVLIGENGCGKSNILEAIAIASAAVENKLDNEFLASRGIRVTDPRLMRSAFDTEDVNKKISISIGTSDIADNLDFILQNENSSYSKWQNIGENNFKLSLRESTESDSYDFILEGVSSYAEGQKIEEKKIDIINKKEVEKIIKTELKKMDELQELTIKEIAKSIEKERNIKKLIEEKKDEEISKILIKEATKIFFKKILDPIVKRVLKKSDILYLGKFLIFSPENPCLRVFEEEGQIEPLGIRGEGLFKLLKVLNQESKDKIAEIRERLRLINWFGDFNIPENQGRMERSLGIRDKYIDNSLDYFDQKSTNEGFLFLLFYFALFVSEDTPKFFAVDNIDASLNPKLCSRLVTELVELAKKYDKQAIFTTHNPAVLDGLNLDDEEQRLFVVYRNKAGHTKLRRILKPETVEGQEPVKLSEAFLRGYIGGLPKNF